MCILIRVFRVDTYKKTKTIDLQKNKTDNVVAGVTVFEYGQSIINNNIILEF